MSEIEIRDEHIAALKAELAAERAAKEAAEVSAERGQEGYPANWAKVILMVSPSGEMHAIGGIREAGNGDMPYVGLKRIRSTIASERAAKDAIEGQTPWEFACKWYGVDEIAHAIARDPSAIPEDITSREFAGWLTHQYRLAMNKGLQLGQSEAIRERDEARERLAQVEADAAVCRGLLEQVEKRWTFNGGQQHTHTWHDWADVVPWIRKALATNAGKPLLDEVARLREAGRTLLDGLTVSDCPVCGTWLGAEGEQFHEESCLIGKGRDLMRAALADGGKAGGA